MKTYSQFQEAFILAKAKCADWRMRSMVGGIALNRACDASDAPAAGPTDFSDLMAALDDVVAGRSYSDPDAVALRAVFRPQGGVR